MKTFAILALALVAAASATPVTKQGDIYEGCGDTKGCVGKPAGCDATGVSCTAEVRSHDVQNGRRGLCP